ncbi:hypothetical protein GCM10009731_37060 [Streptomyces globosus]
MRAAEPVIWSTSRFCTVSCVQVPALETKLAAAHQRIPRWRRARHGERSPAAPAGGEAEAGVGAAGAGAAERAGEAEEDTAVPGNGARTGHGRLRRLGAAGAAPSGRGSGTGGIVPFGPCWQTGSASRA